MESAFETDAKILSYQGKRLFQVVGSGLQNLRSGRLIIPHLQQWIYHPDKKIKKETQALNDTLEQTDLLIFIGHFT